MGKNCKTKKNRELRVDKFSTAYARHKWLGHAHRTGDGQHFCIHTNMFVFFFDRWLNFQVRNVARLQHNHTNTLHVPMYSWMARMYGTKRPHWTVEYSQWYRMALVALLLSMAPTTSLRWKFRLDETNAWGQFLSNLCDIILFACVCVSPRTGCNSYWASRFSHLSEIIIITATRLCAHSKAIIEMRYRWLNEPQGDSGGWLRTSQTTTIDFDFILSWKKAFAVSCKRKNRRRKTWGWFHAI